MNVTKEERDIIAQSEKIKDLVSQARKRKDEVKEGVNLVGLAIKLKERRLKELKENTK